MQNILRSTSTLLALSLAFAGCNRGGGSGGTSSTAASTAPGSTTTTTTTTPTTRGGTTVGTATPGIGTKPGLTPIGPTGGPAIVPVGALQPVSRWLYLANIGDDAISQFSIDATTGALTPVNAAVSVPAGSEPDHLASDPSGKFVFCALPGNLGQIQTFAVNPNTGALTPGSVANAGSGCNACAVDPTGTLLLASNEFGDSISAFPIDPTTGKLGTQQTVSLGAGAMPAFVAIDPTGTFAYSANYKTNTVSAMSIEPGTGKLALVGSAVPCGPQPFVLTVDPSGAHVYVGCHAVISTFNRDPVTGVLTPIGSGSAPISTLGGVVGMAADPTGQFLYVSCGTTAAAGSVNSVNSFTIDPTTGALTEILPAAVLGATALPFFMGLDNSGTFAFSPDYDNNLVLSFKVDPTTGDLAAIAGAAPVAAGNQPGAVLLLK